MILDETIGEFARKLAAREPAPGGGAAASYTGALGAAVAGMAIAYSIKKDEEDRARIAELGEGLDFMVKLREDLLQFTEKDSEAYGAYSEAKKLPRGTPDEKAERKKRIRSALSDALEIPLQAATRCAEGLERLERLAGMISSRLITDAGVAARCLGAACRSLWYNVHINAQALKDSKRGQALQLLNEKMEKEITRLESAIIAQVEGKTRDG